MPKGDKTGPNGSGPMSGRKAGFCTGNNMSGFESSPGMGMRRLGLFSGSRRGRGRGFRNMYYQTGKPGWMRFGNVNVSSEDEKNILSEEAEMLKKELQNIESRLGELNSEE